MPGLSTAGNTTGERLSACRGREKSRRLIRQHTSLNPGSASKHNGDLQRRDPRMHQPENDNFFADITSTEASPFSAEMNPMVRDYRGSACLSLPMHRFTY